MRIELQRARIVDPQHEQHGQLASLLIEDGKFMSAGPGDKPADHTIDLDGKYALAGGIDIHLSLIHI